MSEREKIVREKERELERAARSDARRYLLDARQEIEKTIKELRAAGADQIEAAAIAARRAAEQRAAEAGQKLAELDRAPRRRVRGPKTEGRERRTRR